MSTEILVRTDHGKGIGKQDCAEASGCGGSFRCSHGETRREHVDGEFLPPGGCPEDGNEGDNTSDGTREVLLSWGYGLFAGYRP